MYCIYYFIHICFIRKREVTRHIWFCTCLPQTFSVVAFRGNQRTGKNRRNGGGSDSGKALFLDVIVCVCVCVCVCCGCACVFVRMCPLCLLSAVVVIRLWWC